MGELPIDPKLYQCIGEEIGAFKFSVCAPPFGCSFKQTIPLGLDANQDDEFEPIPFPGNEFGLNVATCCSGNVEVVPGANIYCQ